MIILGVPKWQYATMLYYFTFVTVRLFLTLMVKLNDDKRHREHVDIYSDTRTMKVEKPNDL